MAFLLVSASRLVVYTCLLPLLVLVFVSNSVDAFCLPPKQQHQHHVVSSLSQRSSTSFSTRLFWTTPSASESSAEGQQEYLATCIPGLAPVLADELLELGASDVTPLGNAAVSFTSSQENPHIGLKALLWVRTAHQILEKLVVAYDVTSRDDVYDAVRSLVDVKKLLGDGKGGMLTISSKVILNGRVPKDVSHSHYTALTIKNALVDEVRDLRGNGERPDVDTDQADVPLLAILYATQLQSQGQGTQAADMTLYRSLHPPGSLHKRGYRGGGAIHMAAMKESLAAGLLLSAGFMDALRENETNNNGIIMVDPMCGSGSLVLEAAMMAVDLAPGLMRIKCGMPGFQMPPVLRWKSNSNDEDLTEVWKEMLMDATSRARQGIRNVEKRGVEIQANDLHDGALDLLDMSLAKAGLNSVVKVNRNNCRDWKALVDGSIQHTTADNTKPVWVMTNPPWGVRLSDEDHESWESLRIFLRSNSPAGTQAWVLSGNKSATKHLGLRRSQSIVLKTGEIDLRWLQYMILDKNSKPNKPPIGDERQQQKQQRTYRNDGERNDSNGIGRQKDQASSPGRYNTNERDNSERRELQRKPATNTKRPVAARTPKINQAAKVPEDDSWY